MKLSALLLSVNIAASIPVAFCQMAPAAEEGKAEGGDWLKNNLATIKKGKADLPTSRLKVNIPERISSGDKSFDAYVARLKPIHKAGKLPSQRDLNMQLVAQTPHMGFDPSQLSGNVSASQYSDYPAPRAAYRQPQSLAHSVPKGLTAGETGSLRDSAIAMARQAISGSHHMGRAPSAKNLKNAKRAQPKSLQDKMDDWLGEPKGDEKMIGQAGAMLVQAPIMPQQLTNLSSKDLETVNPPVHPLPQSSAGPAPFPLNLVPEAQLKEFIRGGRGGATPAMQAGAMPGGMGAMGGMGGQMGMGHMGGMGAGAGAHMGGMRQAPPKAFFGSWHGSNGVGASTGNSHLPRAGFQSNMASAHHSSKNVAQMRPKNRYSKGPKVVAVRSAAKPAPAQYIQAHLPPATATYGSYHGY